MPAQGKLTPQQLTPHTVLYLQRSIGNRAVAQLLGKAQSTAATIVSPSATPWQPIEQPREHFAEEWQALELETPASNHGEAIEPAANTGTLTGMIQRKIEQTFTETQQTANIDTIKSFYMEKVVPELKNALKAVKEVHLAAHAQGLNESKEKFQKSVETAKKTDTAENWKLSAEALDELVNVVNMVDLESTRPGAEIWDDEGQSEWKPIPGSMSKEGMLDHWGSAPDQVLNPDHYVTPRQPVA
jgi:hypothetical protein